MNSVLGEWSGDSDGGTGHGAPEGEALPQDGEGVPEGKLIQAGQDISGLQKESGRISGGQAGMWRLEH